MGLVIGLTGLIGSGKTKVSDEFRILGARIIDTDKISHQLTMRGSLALDLIKYNIGYECINSSGELDRAYLRNLIFNDNLALQKLESILHPLIYQSVVAKINKPHNAPYSVIVVPLLFKYPNFLNLTKKNIYISTSIDNIILRVSKRSNLSPELIMKIIATQVNPETQAKLADFIIDNNGQVDELLKQIKELHQIFLNYVQ